MHDILIAEEHPEAQKMMAEICSEAGFRVTVTSSVAELLQWMFKKTAGVILLASTFDELTALDLVPLLRQRCRDLPVILVSNEMPLPTIRKMRKEGIFYHLLKPILAQDKDELQQVIRCALDQSRRCYC